MAWYRTGTVSVTASSTTVTGAGTAFVANARVGDAFIGPDGRIYEIANVASDSAISIQPAYIGSTASGQNYAIAPVQGYVKRLADEAGELINEYADTVDSLGTAATKDVTNSATDTTAGRLLQVGAGHQQLDPTLYRKANIVGTVSQSGGVPTGAIIQRGSNANGEFLILADGTVFFSQVSPLAAGNRSETWTYPLTLTGSVSVYGNLLRLSTDSNGGGYVNFKAPSSSTAVTYQITQDNPATSVQVLLNAKGRIF